MNILLTNLTYKPHLGGIENSFYYIAKELKSRGHKVVIICGDKTLNDDGRLPEHEVIDRIDVYRFKRYKPSFSTLKMFIDIVDIYKSYKIVKKINKIYDFDITILRNVNVGLGTVLALKEIKSFFIVPALSMLQDKKLISEFSGNIIIKYLKWWYFNNILLNQHNIVHKQLMKLVNYTFVFSNNMKSQIALFHGDLTKKVKIIKPGVDKDVFIPNSEKYKLRKEINIPLDSFVFLFTGRIVKVKGIHFALKALSKINDKKVLLVIVGEGPELIRLKKLSKTIKVENKTRFYDFTKKPEQYYGLSDAFIMSSTYEPFGQTILEALSSGLPVVGFKPDGINVMTATDEIVEDGDNGILCDFNVEALSDAMYRMLNTNKNKLNEIARMNRQKVESQYSWVNFCEKILFNESDLEI